MTKIFIYVWKKTFLLQGQILHTDVAVDKAGCWSICKSTKGCNWFSFDTAVDQICILFETCREIESNPQFVSGQKECQYDQELSE